MKKINEVAYKSKWILSKSVPKSDILFLRKYVFLALEDFPLQFRNSVEPNTAYNKPYLFSFDHSKTGIPELTYASMIGRLIDLSNIYLNDSNRFKSYKIGILGDNSEGYIVIYQHRNMSEKSINMLGKSRKDSYNSILKALR